MKNFALKTTLAAAAIMTMGGLAMAEDIGAPWQSPGDNFAAKPGCGLYGACYRVDQDVRPYGVTVSHQNSYDARDAGLAEVLGNVGYRQGLDTFNVIDDIP